MVNVPARTKGWREGAVLVPRSAIVFVEKKRL